jgi:hypothetical protein
VPQARKLLFARLSAMNHPLLSDIFLNPERAMREASRWDRSTKFWIGRGDGKDSFRIPVNALSAEKRYQKHFMEDLASNHQSFTLLITVVAADKRIVNPGVPGNRRGLPSGRSLLRRRRSPVKAAARWAAQ